MGVTTSAGRLAVWPLFLMHIVRMLPSCISSLMTAAACAGGNLSTSSSQSLGPGGGCLASRGGAPSRGDQPH